jgi:DNA polymerase-1
MALLIDADILVYRAIASVEREVEWEPDVWTMTSDLTEAHTVVDDMLASILASAPKSDYLMCFTDSVNFRKELNPSYKSHRTGRKPMGFKPFRTQCMEKFKSVTKPTLEADDVIGILATKPGADHIIVSADKDLLTIPGKHLIDGKIVVVTEREADMMFMTQTLTGDAADGYPGCPGIGKVKAEKILSSMAAQEDPWDFVLGAYEKAGLTEADAILQARMARILRWQDWNQEEQKVRLWSPTKSN